MQYVVYSTAVKTGNYLKRLVVADTAQEARAIYAKVGLNTFVEAEPLSDALAAGFEKAFRSPRHRVQRVGRRAREALEERSPDNDCVCVTRRARTRIEIRRPAQAAPHATRAGVVARRRLDTGRPQRTCGIHHGRRACDVRQVRRRK